MNNATAWMTAALLGVALASGCAGTAAPPPASPPARALETPPAAPASPAPTARPASAASAPPHSAPSVEDFVRVRCATDGRDTVTTWQGAVYAYPPASKPVRLFKVVGANIARCARDKRGWYLSGREVMLYLDPKTGARLDTWTNPWTQQAVSVMHVANDPVQFRLTGAPSMQRVGGVSSFEIDVPLFYPSPLARNAAAGPHPAMYQAGEFFTLSAPAAEVGDAARPQVSWMTLTWHRIGPWLPWMSMGQRPGHLVYTARGGRAASVAALAPALKRLLAELPGYEQAPRCFLARRNATSWSYFAQHGAAHAAGKRFPLPTQAIVTPCTAD